MAASEATMRPYTITDPRYNRLRLTIDLDHLIAYSVVRSLDTLVPHVGFRLYFLFRDAPVHLERQFLEDEYLWRSNSVALTDGTWAGRVGLGSGHVTLAEQRVQTEVLEPLEAAWMGAVANGG
jgi:hypothetical protein